MSWEALFSLQGHSPYLLGAYGVTLALIGLEAALLWRRSRARRAAQQTARRVDGTAP
ncbi:MULTISPECIES: heme exporter protein CcmD [Achromobacter]|uniref:heme exporter protein CcmD n=1 Tax=Achromobacter sp. TaxID=134375 RepID=UPI002F91FB06